MQSSAENVDAYLVEVPEGRRAAIDRLRSMCVATLSGYEECMDYGMPSYRRPDGEIEVSVRQPGSVHLDLHPEK